MPDKSLLVKQPSLYSYGQGHFIEPAINQMYADRGQNQQGALQSVQDNPYLASRIAKLFNLDNALSFLQDPLMGGGHRNSAVNAETAGKTWAGSYNPLTGSHNNPENIQPGTSGPSYEVLQRIATLLFPEYAARETKEQFQQQYPTILNSVNKNYLRPEFDYYEQFQ